MVDTMVEIDQRWDRLRHLAAHMDHPEKTANEATLLWEQFREAQRLPESAKLGKSFRTDMAKSEQAALRLRDMLAADAKGAKLPAPDLQSAIDGVAKSCKNCHESYRDSTVAHSSRP
jgi:cytochrome c556